MSFGKLNKTINIVSTTPVKDSEGFVTQGDIELASVRAYKEDKNSSERWANRAVFSTANALFRFRYIPGVVITTAEKIICDGKKYNILSVENIRGRSMYYEIYAITMEGSDG